jgi:hypothetical protein
MSTVPSIDTLQERIKQAEETISRYRNQLIVEEARLATLTEMLASVAPQKTFVCEKN